MMRRRSKIWHRHPVWFLDGNPTVGYSKLKAGIRLMFWSGASFDEDKLQPGTGKFKDALEAERKFREVRKKYPSAMLLKPESSTR